MRLAVVSTLAGSSWGGSEELWAQTARSALHAKHDVLLLTYRWPTRHPRIAELVALGALLHERASDRKTRSSWLRNSLANPFSALVQFAPDVVLVNQAATYDISYSREMTALLNALRRTPLPYVLLCHCEESAPTSPRRLRRARSAFQHAQITGFLSERLQRVTEIDLGTKLDRTLIFRNPIRLDTATCLPWPDGPLQFALVGRLDEIKGPDLLLAALSQPEWRARPWSLTLCGSGPSEDALRAQAAAAGIADRVRFAGFVSDIAALWREHHVLVMPSRAEGVPLALQEAMLCGRPAVMTNVGGVSDWLIDGTTGFLVFQQTADALSRALERLWQARASLAAMGQAAHRHMLAHRDPDPGATLLSCLEHTATRCVALTESETS